MLSVQIAGFLWLMAIATDAARFWLGLTRARLDGKPR
jgi:hypothetical protein